ncbi:thiamine pyrophosphate-binding protein [Arthrobacter gengyunqii]|uniref:Thiamine pyrophosphate-binding protein n=1 Tax=Arthrobacter gengyunqii TaxID=2886940 RepID=A0A9X1M0I3_9MICC|nr:thiamine pyrophosphate-binding protein [Arthrobacter gengyunqii]MCC3269168.1 thiamine pyrophosphate-binding protein [Arthrobacter gengyunqii]UOY94872.1 thiamine pyrophosphate-binding protein [Arthrobacter gengyunqii]
MSSFSTPPKEVSTLIAEFLKRRGVHTVFGLQGGHIQPIWDQAARLGIRIVDVRDERAAVHMAQAHAELSGELGVAMVTAGPGVTNTVTAIANAHISGTPLLLIGGCPPRPQINMGPLQDVAHTEILRPITRQSRTARVSEQVIRELDEAVARAFGDGGEPGPVYLEIPTDVLRESVPAALVLDEHMAPKNRRSSFANPEDLKAAASMISEAKRLVVVTGRGARRSTNALEAFLKSTDCVYLDTQETKGLLSEKNAAHVGAVRGRAMAEADLVLVVGRKLDYQLGYGSPAAWPNARFIRIADTASELIDNRRGGVEILADVSVALDGLTAIVGSLQRESDEVWAAEMRTEHARRVESSRTSLGDSPAGADGSMHPNRIFDALHKLNLQNPILIADGGDLLSFARIGLPSGKYLDSGAFGCLGVGVPYAIAASLEFEDTPVVCVSGDGAFGFNAIELDTAVRHGARAVFIVANNSAWNIERYDQETNYGLVVGTELGATDYAAWARAAGAYGERVENPEDLLPALRRAMEAAPAVLDVVVTREAVSSDATKGLGFVPDYQALMPWNDAEIRRRSSDEPASGLCT